MHLLGGWVHRRTVKIGGTGVHAGEEVRIKGPEADALAEKHGARIEQVYWTMGHYDAVEILEAPDDESASAYILDLTSTGNLRTSTLRAFDHDQMQAIIQRLG
jgi:uncharacterized protein with GYD domain